MLIFKNGINKMIIFDRNKIKAMKKILLLGLVALFIISCDNQGTQSNQTTKDEPTVKVMDTRWRKDCSKREMVSSIIIPPW